MTDKIDLREIERRASKSYHEDGLIEIFIGGYLIWFGARFFLEVPPLFHIVPFSLLYNFVPLVGLWVWNYLKRMITFPRIGYVRFTAETRRRILRDSTIIIFTAGFVTLIGFFTLLGRPELTPWWVKLLNRYGLIFSGSVLAAMIALHGRIMNVKRLYMYSAASLVVFASGQFLLHMPSYSLHEKIGGVSIGFGMIMIGGGAFHLHGFLARYTNEGVTL